MLFTAIHLSTLIYNEFSRRRFQRERCALSGPVATLISSYIALMLPVTDAFFYMLTHLHPVIIGKTSDHLLGIFSGLPELAQNFITGILVILKLHFPLFVNYWVYQLGL